MNKDELLALAAVLVFALAALALIHVLYPEGSLEQTEITSDIAQFDEVQW